MLRWLFWLDLLRLSLSRPAHRRQWNLHQIRRLLQNLASPLHRSGSGVHAHIVKVTFQHIAVLTLTVLWLRFLLAGILSRLARLGFAADSVFCDFCVVVVCDRDCGCVVIGFADGTLVSDRKPTGVSPLADACACGSIFWIAWTALIGANGMSSSSSLSSMTMYLRRQKSKVRCLSDGGASERSPDPGIFAIRFSYHERNFPCTYLFGFDRSIPA
jgi:hypothetical protein